MRGRLTQFREPQQRPGNAGIIPAAFLPIGAYFYASGDHTARPLRLLPFFRTWRIKSTPTTFRYKIPLATSHFLGYADT